MPSHFTNLLISCFPYQLTDIVIVEGAEWASGPMTWSLLVRHSAFHLVHELLQLLEVLINEVLYLPNMGGDSFDWLGGFAIKLSKPPARFYRSLLSECQGDFPWCAWLPPAPYLARSGILDSCLYILVVSDTFAKCPFILNTVTEPSYLTLIDLLGSLLSWPSG